MKTDIQPDPSMIGGVPQAPFAILPNPLKLFETRARRFAFLAGTSRLAPYLHFLAGLSDLQARLVAELAPPVPVAGVEEARARRMPPVDRTKLVMDPALAKVIEALCQRAQAIDMPEPARLALDAVLTAEDSDRRWLNENVLSDQIPEGSAAPHLFVAAAVQVHLSRLAATLQADRLVPIHTGICPACGGRPATSSVSATIGIENVRYATCSCCATQWNEVRIKCLCCGSTKGISYRSAETTEASVKAEVCRECDSWVKIFYLSKNPTIDPIADDVGSLGLDLMMKETGLKRGGFDPLLVGY